MQGANRLVQRILCIAVVAMPALLAIPVGAQPGAVKEAPAKVALQLASIFSDHMVLQRDQPIPVWGTAEPGATVRVRLGGKSSETTADENGKWHVDLGQLPAGGPFELHVVSGGAAFNLTDVLIGEVWIASGQSNMQWTVSNSNNAKEEIAAANWPEIRIVNVPRQPSLTPRDSFKTLGWAVCQPKTIKSFSAVAYFFGRHLHEELQVPIGLISTNYGGTPMEAWTSQTALASRLAFAQAAERAKSPLHADKKKAKNHPSGLFNAMVHPLIPYGIRGVIWYQGEANATRHQHYRELSELMITDWRTRWGQGEFPFLLVQLAGWKPDPTHWPYLREAQLQTVQTVPNTGMAVAADVGDANDIHPRNKQDVGKRLALAARALAYGEGIVYSGPIYREMESHGDHIRLKFDHCGSGLMAKQKALQGFTIAGADQKFVPAVAKIEGNDVAVSSSEVKQPVAVRYNWTGWTEGNLYNAEGLPASPFRTDRF